MSKYDIPYNELLDSPIKTIAPKGYLACLDCHVYYHHPIIYCKKCGKKVIKHKDISIKDFILSAGAGAGPMNTLYNYIVVREGISWSDFLDRKCNKDALKVCKDMKKYLRER